MYFMGSFSRPIDRADIHHIQSAKETELLQNGQVVEMWDHVFEWDEDCVRASHLEQWRGVADPLCDTALKAIFLTSSACTGVDLLAALQAATEQRPGPARDFYEEVQRIPPPGVLATPEQITRSQAFFYRNAPAIVTGLLHFSLAGGFTSARITRVLHAVSYLVPNITQGASSMTQEASDRVFSRLLETLQFVLDVMGNHDPTFQGSDNTTPLEPGGEGWKSAVRVRMLHGVARRRILDRYSAKHDIFGEHGYNFTTDGYPINQEDMAGTLASFAVAPLWCMERMGYSITDQERSDFIAHWRHVGFYMGVDSKILSCHFANPQKADKFLMSIIVHLMDFSSISADGKPSLPLPTLPILYAISNRPPYRTQPSYHFAMTRYLVGNAMADFLEVPKTSWKTYITLLASNYITRLPVAFSSWYRVRRWGERRESLVKEGFDRVVKWQLGRRRTQFRARGESLQLTEDIKAAEKILLHEGDHARFVRAYRNLLLEMALVLCACGLGVSYLGWSLWRSIMLYY